MYSENHTKEYVGKKQRVADYIKAGSTYIYHWTLKGTEDIGEDLGITEYMTIIKSKHV